MRITRVKIENFRGIAQCEMLLPEHAVLVGDNNSCKSTLLEAIDLVLGPDRLAKQPAIDEHDFHAGKYQGTARQSKEIRIEVVVSALSPEQIRHFKYHLEWWDTATKSIVSDPPPERIDAANVQPVLRVGFVGSYNEEEDDFVADTFFQFPIQTDDTLKKFRASDKRLCGFLFLRTLRTGSRALSLERGSLLDIILRLKEVRLKMWEDVLDELRGLPVADKAELGVSEILKNVEKAVRSFVPSDWAESPHIRVSDLTREHLRKTLTVFMGTGAKREDGAEYYAPFQHQGTGTVNVLVLALLSLIAEMKQSVIFAMEEPEIAIPPHAQKQIINNIRTKSAQALFTSHSPYVLEEFSPSEIIVLQRDTVRALSGIPATFPSRIKAKNYRAEFRSRFSEALLARRVLVVEGRTEYDSYLAVSRCLSQLEPKIFKSLDSMGIAVFDAGSDAQVAPFSSHFKGLGKTVFAIFDKQDAGAKEAIEKSADRAFESPENGFEDLVVKGTPENALRRFALSLVEGGEWPQHLGHLTPTLTTTFSDLQHALREYLRWSKGAASASDLLCSCTAEEVPPFIRNTLLEIAKALEPKASENSQNIDQSATNNEEPK